MRPLWIALLSAISLCACASHPQTIKDLNLESTLYSDELAGIRWGILVADLEGTPLFEQHADQRFIPASNTKLVTTAAAFNEINALNTANARLATHVVLKPSDIIGGNPDIMLVGRGDAEMESGPDCQTRCLEFLADQVVQSGVTNVADIIADASWFPEEKWPPGWSWEDLQSYYGAAVSALSLNKNIAYLNVRPSANVGQPAKISWVGNAQAFDIENTSTTSLGEAPSGIRVERLPGSKTLNINGEMSKDEPAKHIRLGVDSPSEYAAQVFKKHLLDRGVNVFGVIRIHRDKTESLNNSNSGENCVSQLQPAANASAINEANIIARLPPPDWASTLKTVNKESQNLFAEMMLRQLGKICGNGTTQDGLTRVKQLLTEAGVSPNSYDFFDGSGMSVYNRVSPRAIVKILTYADTQAWGNDWRETFPIGGVDGGLYRRFAGTTLEGKIFAKTGTLKGVNALSGYMISASGRELAFSIIANDRPLGLRSATSSMDQALIKIAKKH